MEKKQRQLQVMEENLAKEMKQWQQMYKLAKDEIDTFDLHSKVAYGSTLRQRMQEQLEYDINSLESIIGEEVTKDDLAYLAQHNPNIFYTMLMKVFEFLVYLSNIPVDKDEGTTLNLYEDFLDKVVEAAKEKNGGELPTWIKFAEKIFKFGKDIKDRMDQGQDWEKIMEDAAIPGVVNMMNENLSLQSLQSMPAAVGQFQTVPAAMNAQFQPQFIFAMPVTNAILI